MNYLPTFGSVLAGMVAGSAASLTYEYALDPAVKKMMSQLGVDSTQYSKELMYLDYGASWQEAAIRGAFIGGGAVVIGRALGIANVSPGTALQRLV